MTQKEREFRAKTAINLLADFISAGLEADILLYFVNSPTNR